MNRKNKQTPLIFLKAAILTAVFLSACGQDYNSLSSDAALGQDLKIDCSNPANDELCAAATVLKNHCFKCHSNWAQFESNADYLAAGSSLVVAGDPNTSTIVTSLINYGGDMPQGSGALSSADALAIRTWVANIPP